MGYRSRVRVRAFVVSLAVLVAGFGPATASDSPGRAASPEEPLVRPDLVSAQVTARLTGKRVEILDRRTEDAVTFANPDGSFTATLHPGPVRVLGSNGWQPIDTTLVERSDGIHPAVSKPDVRFSKGGTGEISRVGLGRRWLSSKLEGVSLPAPALNGSVATYRDIEPGVDLVLEARRLGVKEQIVLNRRPAKPVTFRFPLSTENLRVQREPDGRLLLLRPDDTVFAVSDPPLMWGAETDPVSLEPTRVSPVATTLVVEDGRPVLEVTPGFAFLSDPSVTLPITIDPTSGMELQKDTFVHKAYPTTSFYNETDLRVGTYDGGTSLARSFMKFNISSVIGTQISKAELSVYEWHSASCTDRNVNVVRVNDNFNSSTTWNDQPPTTSTIFAQKAFAHGYSSSCPDAWETFTITSLVQSWADGVTNYGLALKANTETDSLSWKRFNSGDAGSKIPKLEVWYNSYPNTPTSPQTDGKTASKTSPGTYTNKTRPGLSAVVSDPDGGSVRARICLWTAAGTTVACDVYGTSVASGSRSTYTTSTLAQGTYKWRVRSYDGTLLSTNVLPNDTEYYYVTVDTGAPSTPSVSSSAYPADQWGGGVGTSGTFTFSASDTLSGISGYNYAFDSPTPNLWTTSSSVSWTPTVEGEHHLYVQAKDKAGNVSAVTDYRFYVGNGAVVSPEEGARTQKWLVLRNVAKPSFTTVTYEYRRGETDSWATIAASSVYEPGNSSPISGWPVTIASAPELNWDAPSALGGVDGPIQIRANFGGTGVTAPVTVKLDQAAFGSDYAAEAVGPGAVNLVTGNYAVGSTDASIGSYGSDLTISRTFNSRDPSAGSTGAFGPGWVLSAAVEAAGADWVSLYDASEHSQGAFVNVTASDGTIISFRKISSGYEAEAGFEDLTLSKPSSTEFKLADFDGNVTTFTKPSGATSWLPSEVRQPGSGNTTSYTYETPQGGSTRVKQILAPVPAGVSCTTLVRGCRALDLIYASATTATGSDPSQWGDYAGRLARVDFTVWDPDPNQDGNTADAAMTTTAIARYSYDTAGRLRAAWDPRLATPLKTTYAYDSDGRLTTITPPGEEAWTFSYRALTGEPSSAGRLWKVSRPALAPASGNAVTTLVYDVPVTGTGAPYDLSAAAAAAWGQTDLPVDATAIFPPDQQPADPPTSYERATVHYVDRDARQTNVAMPGGFVSTTEYDEHGNMIRELTPGNRARALAYGTTTEEHAARAVELDTHRRYSADGLELLDEWGPLHEVTLPTGEPVQAHAHNVYVYDQGAPTGEVYHLPTRTESGAAPADGGVDVDVRVTTTTWDWGLRQPTSTTIDPSGLALASTTVYDSTTGLVKETRLPGSPSNGGTAHSTKTIYYTPGTHQTDSECGERPEWSNLPCKIKPAAQPGTVGLPHLPETVFTYTVLNQIATKVETVDNDPAADDERTTTFVYDAAGRLESESITATVGEALPQVTYAYDTATGQLTTTTASGQTITRAYDTLGRLTSYTDASGNVATTTYDLLDRPVTTTDGKGSQTRSYDEGSERRGLLGKIVDSAAGAFTATYDADGQQVTRTYPNGLTATTSYDEAGSAVGLVYEKIQGCTENCTWLSFAVSESIHGQWRTQASELSQQTYSYDAASRLVKVEDIPAAAGCTTRAYGFDADSNRTSLTTRAPNVDGTCDWTSAGTTVSRTYDPADRLTDTGYTYDLFGRTTQVPAADAGGNAITATYYANDLVRSLAQSGTTRTWTLDPARRFLAWTDTAGTSKANRYADNTDSPAWISENADGSSWTRNIAGIDGDLVAIQDQAGVIRLQLANLHGDLVATAHPDVTPPQGEEGLLSTFESTEYGVARTGIGLRYGWLGAMQRAHDTLTGIVLMGVRLYVTSAGRFLQVDPVEAGSCSNYEYVCGDPLTRFDLDGRLIACFLGRLLRKRECDAGLARAGARAYVSASEAYGRVRAGVFRRILNESRRMSQRMMNAKFTHRSRWVKMARQVGEPVVSYCSRNSTTCRSIYDRIVCTIQARKPC